MEEVIRIRMAALVSERRYDPAYQYALLDGVIRTVEQARRFGSLFDVRMAIYFDDQCLPPGELERRWNARGRKGETIELYRQHLDAYRTRTLPLLEHYAGRLHRVDPSGSAEEITRSLEKTIFAREQESPHQRPPNPACIALQ